MRIRARDMGSTRVPRVTVPRPRRTAFGDKAGALNAELLR